MSLNRRFEFLCGVAAGLLGLVVLGMNLFGQETASTICGTNGCVTTHTNFLQSQSIPNILDALVVVGGPPILVAVGAIWASRRGAIAGRVLLWVGTLLLGLFAFIGLLFGGGITLALQIASFALAAIASIFALAERSHKATGTLGGGAG